jgi:zinc/manganese transport system substrate-binding protein
MNKKILLSLFPLLLLVSPVEAKVAVLSCEPEWAALAKSLGGEHLEIYSATTNQQDPHQIQARPSLIAKARQADLLVCTGAELEGGWLPLLLRKSGNPKIQQGQTGHFMAADQMTLLEKPTVLDRSLGDIHAAGNPHVHLDPTRVMQIAENLTHTLIKIDPANQAIYRQNLEHFTDEWRNAKNEWDKKTKDLRGKSIVVHHNNWTYLEHWLGLTRVANIEPKPGIPPTSSYLSKLVSSLQQTPAEMILYASYQDDKAAHWLSQKTGIRAIRLDFSPAENETLLQWFDRLIDQLLGVRPMKGE